MKEARTVDHGIEPGVASDEMWKSNQNHVAVREVAKANTVEELHCFGDKVTKRTSGEVD